MLVFPPANARRSLHNSCSPILRGATQSVLTWKNFACSDYPPFIVELAALQPAPESVPINLLVHIPGTPLAEGPKLEPLEFVRTVAVARICLPTSMVRLSAGRAQM